MLDIMIRKGVRALGWQTDLSCKPNDRRRHAALHSGGSATGYSLPLIPFDKLKNILLELKNNSDILKIDLISYIMEDAKIVGLITETNQFIPIVPLNINGITEMEQMCYTQFLFCLL